MWDAASRHHRVFWWLVAGAGLSLVVQFIPSWTNTAPNLGPARIFGGQEFLLTGMLLLVGAMVQWWCSDLRQVSRGLFLFFTCTPLMLLVVAGFSYSELGRLGDHTPSQGVILEASIVFGACLLVGTLATWLEE